MYGKMHESGLTEIIPLICTSATWGQHPVLSQPESPQGAPSGVVAVADGGHPVSILSSFRAHRWGSYNVMA